MKKALALLIIGLILMSCTSYEGDTKIIYEGRVLDATGNPLAGIPVNILVKRTIGIWAFPILYSRDTDLISYTTTDAMGRYKLIFPKPKDGATMSLLLNFYNPATAAYPNLSSTVVYNLLEQNNTDYKVTFSDNKLYDIANSVPLTIQFNPQSGKVIQKMNLKGLVRENYIDYNLDLVEEDTTPWINNFNNVVQVAPNQTLTIEYQVQDQSGNITVQEAQVQINDQALTYQLNY